MMPVSLLASMIETSAGRSSAARRSASIVRSTMPVAGLTGRDSASGTALSTESCSIAETRIRRRPLPLKASWFASLPPLTKTTSRSSVPTSAAISRRAASTARRAARPARCTEEGLPTSANASATAAATAGRTGAVALCSRYVRRDAATLRSLRPCPLLGGVAGRGAASLVAVNDAAGTEHPLLADIGERDRTEIEMDLVAELLPQIVGQAAALVAAAPGGRAGGAACGPDRLVDGQDNVRDSRLAGGESEEVAATRAAHAAHQPALAQPGEELFEVGQRDFLAIGDLGERHRIAVAMLGEIDHRHDGVASLGAQPHRSPPSWPKPATSGSRRRRASLPSRRFLDINRAHMLL